MIYFILNFFFNYQQEHSWLQQEIRLLSKSRELRGQRLRLFGKVDQRRPLHRVQYKRQAE